MADKRKTRTLRDEIEGILCEKLWIDDWPEDRFIRGGKEVIDAILTALEERLPPEHEHSDKEFNEDGSSVCACCCVDSYNQALNDVRRMIRGEGGKEAENHD